MSQEHPDRLDRIDLAIQLRKAGNDIDFEDWDGLSDGQVYTKVGRLVTRIKGEDDEV